MHIFAIAVRNTHKSGRRRSLTSCYAIDDYAFGVIATALTGSPVAPANRGHMTIRRAPAGATRSRLSSTST